MASTTVKKDLQVLCEMGVSDNALILPPMDQIAVNLINEDYLDYSTDSKIMFRAWDNAIKRFDLDWAAFFIDDLFEFEPLGIKVSKFPGVPFAVNEYMPTNQETMNSLKIPDPYKDYRMPIVLEAIELIRQQWADNILICGSVAAPFTALTLLYGIEQTMYLLYDDMDFLRKNLKFMEELGITWAKAMTAKGADIIWVGDCSASSRFIPLNLYNELCLEPAKKVVSEIQKAGATVVYHAGENKLDYLVSMIDTGAEILSVEGGIELGLVKDAVGDRICLSGGLDPVKQIWYGTDESIPKDVDRLVMDVASKGGCIINSGESIPEATPVKNLETMITSIRNSWKNIKGK